MASLTHPNIITDGFIYRPALQHQWLVSFDFLDDRYENALSRQAIMATLNIVKGELEIIFEQPLDGQDFLYAIEILANHPRNQVYLEMLDGNNNVYCRYKFNGKLVDHECVFAYSKSDVVKHVLKFKSKK